MDIQSSKAGKVIRDPQGYNSYVPYPLPPKINWDNKLVSTLSRADYLLGKLAREGSKLPNPHLLIRPFVAREAVLSSKIEGTQATIGDILAHNAGVSVKDKPEDLQEVQNYIIALDFGIARLKALSLSLRLIKEIHEKLMFGVRGYQSTPGSFRTTQNWIGPIGCTVHTARFVPPPANYLSECLTELEIFLHHKQLPPLAHIALCHYQFEAIHPFLDGNGSIGRLLIALLLIERGILPSSLLYLSAFFEATRDEYYRQLFNVSSRGSWSEWLSYFLNGVAVQSEDALSRSMRINLLLDQWKLKISDGSSSTPIDIIDHFAINPYLTVKKIAADLEVAYSTAERGVKKLLKANIIRQEGDNKRDKLYCASEILAILEEPAKIKADPLEKKS